MNSCRTGKISTFSGRYRRASTGIERRAAMSWCTSPPCGYAMDRQRTPARLAARASRTQTARLTDGGTSTAVRVPNSSRSTITPSSASNPQSRSTCAHAARDRVSDTSLEYGRL